MEAHDVHAAEPADEYSPTVHAEHSPAPAADLVPAAHRRLHAELLLPAALV